MNPASNIIALDVVKALFSLCSIILGFFHMFYLMGWWERIIILDNGMPSKVAIKSASYQLRILWNSKNIYLCSWLTKKAKT